MDLKATLEVKSTGLGDDVDKGAERERQTETERQRVFKLLS